MTSVQVVEKPAVAVMGSARASLASVAPRWILANVLPQVLLVAAAATYLGVNGITFAGLITRESAEKLGNSAWAAIAVAVIYLIMIVWMRGAVLRPLVPRFSWLAWLPAALLSGVAMLLAAAGGGLLGVAIVKGLAMSGSQAPSVPTGLALAPFMLGNVIGAEVIGVIVGGLPGLILGAGEALAAFRATRRKAAWILWSAAAWSAIAALITLHALTIVYYPGMPSAALAAIAGATPILLGLAAALLTSPVIAKLVREQNATG
jgi:hypothetical protein